MKKLIQKNVLPAVILFIVSLLAVSCEKEEIDSNFESERPKREVFATCSWENSEWSDGKGIYHSESSRKWPNATVKYVISQQFKDTDEQAPEPMVNNLRRAMDEWRGKTGIQFLEVNPSTTPRKEYILILPDYGSDASIGYANGLTSLKLNIYKTSKYGVYVHELGHVIGLYHEHQRPDRDQYVKVRSDLAETQRYQIPSGQYTTTGSFDFNSVMLYSSIGTSIGYSMVRADNGQPFISSGYTNGVVSQGDINAVKAMYFSSLPEDVSSTHWAFNEIAYMWQNEYLKGRDGVNYVPNGNLTRAEFAALIESIINPTPIRSDINFSDVSSNHWAKSAISTAVRGGYISGYTDGTFRPNENVTKLQMTIALSNGLRLSGGTSNHLSLFTDRSQISNWAQSSVQNATANRFVANYPNRAYFTPNRRATRAEAAVIFYQALVRLDKTNFINNPYLIIP